MPYKSGASYHCAAIHMRFKEICSWCAVLLSFIFTPASSAQSDNFDSGSLDPAWRRAHFNPALVNLSFPDIGTGKALRVRANPVPDQAPAAALLYRDDIYTNFYMALDIVDWPGTDKNQAIVLLARANLTGNPVDTTGIIMNYDASQYGENATDRRQGQLQINMVTNNPPFGTKTLAIAEVTFVPGRPYRLVFEGVGSHYTAKAYDLHDLTRPIVTIEADDDIQGPLPGSVVFEGGGFKSGKCGFLSFSRQGNTGTTDVTVDNYFAAAANPNPGASPGIPHPVPGTPVVSSRIPAKRFENFYNPTNGIAFSITTHTTNRVNASATKLFLNGTDVSGQLIRPTNNNTIAVGLPASALASNTIYSAQIEVEDISGVQKSTNTFWFDTFSEAYLRFPPVRIIEAEDYNYNGGEAYGSYPVPVSGIDTNGSGVNGGGIGYWEQAGLPEVDYHDARTGPEATWASEYRSLDSVGLSAGMFPEISDLNETSEAPIRRSDFVRAQYASSNLLEYVVHRTEPGEWLNYTRTFDPRAYTLFLRAASFGASEVELHEVTSDPKVENQTTVKRGTFRIPNMLTRYNYRYLPLVDDQGNAVALNLSRSHTFRLLMAGTPGQDARKLALNYLLFLPQPDLAALQVRSAVSVTGPYTADPTATIDAAAGRITIPRITAIKYYILYGGISYRITSTQVSGNTVTLQFQPAN